jgi:hypothetical protein
MVEVEALPSEPTPAPSPTAAAAGPGPVALFGLVAAGLAAAYVASAWLFADLGVLRDPSTAIGIHPLVRFNSIYVLLIAFTIAAQSVERRAGARDFAALRAVADVSAPEWEAWRARLRPGPLRLGLAVAAGLALGLAIHVLGGLFARRTAPAWPGHLVWMSLLAPLLFGLMVPLAALGIARARVFAEIGRRARVTWPEPEGLAPFARTGLRGAAYWFLGSSLASLLMLDADAAWLVIAVICVTLGLGVAALLLPSRGIHRRLHGAKAAELAWVRSEIARARDALARSGASGADLAALPALLAWEARVGALREWPFDTNTLLRFFLFLLVPLGSWLGGALVDQLVDALLR